MRGSYVAFAASSRSRVAVSYAARTCSGASAAPPRKFTSAPSAAHGANAPTIAALAAGVTSSSPGARTPTASSESPITSSEYAAPRPATAFGTTAGRASAPPGRRISTIGTGSSCWGPATSSSASIVSDVSSRSSFAQRRRAVAAAPAAS